MNKAKYLIFHCSVSEFGDVEEIRKWHLDRGWRDIGYNAVILNGHRKHGSEHKKLDDGKIEEGRGFDLSKYIESDERGAHALGLNHESLGVCLIGNDKFTLGQFTSAILMARFMMRVVPGISISGHYEMPNTEKTCPNFDMAAFRRAVVDWRMSSPAAAQEYLSESIKNIL